MTFKGEDDSCNVMHSPLKSSDALKAELYCCIGSTLARCAS